MIGGALIARLIPRWRLELLWVGSLIALFGLQQENGLWGAALPAFTLLLVIGVWVIIQKRPTPEDRLHLGLIIGIGGALTVLSLILSGQPPAETLMVLPAAGLVVLGGLNVGALIRDLPHPEADSARKRFALLGIVGIIGLLAILKLPTLQGAVNSLVQADGADRLIGWVGFSYIAFRLMHVLLDYRIGRVTAVSLRDFTLYSLFFPAIPAGPIARLEQFHKELQRELPTKSLASDEVLQGLVRIGIGLLKKFVLADTLALIALTPNTAAHSSSTAILWLMVYAYALQLFFDFSGYVDIAIGIGRIAGITLPENFKAPYFQRNLTQFWNQWHITLSTWFRLYFFMPFSRVLMSTPLKSQRALVILLAQVATMILIGLWHGAALNFVLWGTWHGVGLWAHKQISDRLRGWDGFVSNRPRLGQLITVGSVIATFHFVAVGWVFFALPNLDLIGHTLAGLIGR